MTQLFLIVEDQTFIENGFGKVGAFGKTTDHFIVSIDCRIKRTCNSIGTAQLKEGIVYIGRERDAYQLIL